MTTVAAVAAGVRIWLMIAFPIVFGSDSMVRLMHRDRILISYQLPVLPFCLYVLNLASQGLAAPRALMLSVSAIAAVGFYLLAEDFTDARAAFLSALLFATSPFITAVSIVPYQEILMLAGLIFACHCFVNDRPWAASVCLGLACLTRFEAWTMCPVMAFGYFERKRTFRGGLAGLMLFGWAPVAWIIFQRGLSPPGSYVIDYAITFQRLWRLVYIGAITARESPIPVLLLACMGLVPVLRSGAWRMKELMLAMAFLALSAVTLLFSAHGVPPDPVRYVTSREAQIPVTILILCAAVAIARHPRLGAWLAAAGMLLGAAGAWRYVQHETSRPEIRLGYEAAAYLNRHAAANENILILAQPIPRADLQFYVDRARENSGEAAAAAARRVLATIDTSPLDAQRFRVHSNMRPNRIFAWPVVPAHANWIIAWSDFVPLDSFSAAQAGLARTHPDAILRCGDKSVAIRRVR